jgi:tryptophan halogenase
VQDVRIQHLRAGRRAEAWRNNLLTLGPSAVSTDPLIVSDLHLLCVGVELLLQHRPASATDMRAEAAEFNRRFGGHADHARDLAIAPYWLNGRRGEPFWDAVRGMEVPGSLAGKQALYAARGQVALYDDEPLEQWGWITLFDELGVRPRLYNPLAEYIPDAQLGAHAAKARARMLEAVARMPAHGDYLAALQTATQGSGRG